MAEFISHAAGETIRRAGEALYGRDWQNPLAADLKVSPNTVRRWLAGEAPIPAYVFGVLKLRCWASATKLDECADQLQLASNWMAA